MIKRGQFTHCSLYQKMGKEETLRMGRAELLRFAEAVYEDDQEGYFKCTRPMCPWKDWSLADLRGFKLEYDGDGTFFEAHRQPQSKIILE